MTWTLPAARKVPNYLGVEGGKFRLSPKRPSCVSTQNAGNDLEPIRYEGSRAEAKRKLLTLLDEESKATVVTVGDDYVHAEYQAMIFVDDVEFYFDGDEPLIHMRSTSRVGYGDLGANARRLKSITQAFSSHP